MGLYQLLTDPGVFQFYKSPNDQKNLGFGESNQPYIVTPTPDQVKFLKPIKYEKSTKQIVGFGLFTGAQTIGEKSNLGPYLGSLFASLPNQVRYNPKSWGPDFLWRGNLFGILRAYDDTIRLSKYFTDLKGSGPLFTIKQNLLSAEAVKTESSRGTAYAGGFLNEGIYSPTSTIAQAASGFLGVFLNKQGLDPTGLVPQLAINTYQNSIYTRQFKDNTLQENRLVALTEKSAKTFVGPIPNTNIFPGYGIIPNDDVLIRYTGGPGSVYGIGVTNIKYATDNTGKNPLKVLSTKNNLRNLFPSSTQYVPIPITWDRAQLLDIPDLPSLSETPTREDFRLPILTAGSIGQTTFLSRSPSYNLNATNASGSSTTGNIEKRINYRNPSARGNRSNYIKGKIDLQTGRLMGPSDLINAIPIYQSNVATTNPIAKDLIDFRIGIYNNTTAGVKDQDIQLNWLHFRVFLDDFSDSYGSDWKSIEYMGRGEKFYRYGGFKRDISIAFTVAVASKEELIPIYKKLNYLASSIAPFYSKNGFMSGNLSRITLGGWLFEQPGFISSVDLSIPEESPWETKVPIGDETDQYVDQLPHIVNVKMKFTPIHKFRPQIQSISNTYFNPSDLNPDNLIYKTFTTSKERYIALEDLTGKNNYDNDVTPPPPAPTTALTPQAVNEITPGQTIQLAPQYNSSPFQPSQNQLYSQ
jgi:hypothetical protein